MTLASDTKNSSPDRFGESTTTFGEHAHAEPLPPTLLRLPNLSSSVAAAAESMKTRATDCERTQKIVGCQKPNVAAEATIVSSPSVGAAVTNSQSVAPSPSAPRTTFLTRAVQRDYKVAAFVDRVASRKTLSAALVVVAGIAIWMPRGSDSNNTQPSHASEASEVGASESLSESPSVDRAIAVSSSIQSHGHDDSSASEPAMNAENLTGIQPAFSERMVQTGTASMELATSPSPSNSHENAMYDMDPLVSAANDQIRRMDANYADLPSVSAMDAVAFETEVTSPVDDIANQSGPLNLLMSRTPEPIVNWADYLPPVGAEQLSTQLVSSPPSATPTAAAGRTVAAKSPSGAIPTTAVPAEPDFRFALPGDDELIEADAHVAMPPLNTADPIQTR